MTRTALAALAATLLMVGCDGDGEGPGEAGHPDSAAPPVDASTTADGVSDALADTSPPDPQVVGPGACCLSMGDGVVVWADAGDIWMFTPALARREKLIESSATQKDPVIDGTTLVWADDRNGDFDLWTMDLEERIPAPLVEDAGDQDQPSISDGLVAFVSRASAPHTELQADIWTLRLGSDGSAAPIMSDAFEQSQPHVSGTRVVWADFTNALQGHYIDFADPAMNNADIRGWDEADGTLFTVTDHPSKQLRPAIDGDDVVWMDWRGVNPEPKYAEFQIYGKRLMDAEARLIAWSSWQHPELWQRPALNAGVVAWIAEPEVEGFVTGVFAKALGAAPDHVATLVTESQGVLSAVVLRQGQAAWLGGGRVDVTPLSLQPAR